MGEAERKVFPRHRDVSSGKLGFLKAGDNSGEKNRRPFNWRNAVDEGNGNQEGTAPRESRRFPKGTCSRSSH
jgi:hypothetical protein